MRRGVAHAADGKRASLLATHSCPPAFRQRTSHVSLTLALPPFMNDGGPCKPSETPMPIEKAAEDAVW